MLGSRDSMKSNGRDSIMQLLIDRIEELRQQETAARQALALTPEYERLFAIQAGIAELVRLVDALQAAQAPQEGASNDPA